MYRDHPPEDNSYAVRKMELTDDADAVKRGVMEMSAEGGGDGPEAVSTAMNVARRMEFTRDAAKVAVLIGDAPPHGVEPNSNHPLGWPDGIIWEEEAKQMYDQGIVMHTVGCFPTIDQYEKAVSVYKRIAEITEGRFFPLKEASSLVSLITGIAAEEIDKIAIQEAVLRELGISAEQIAETEITEERLERIASSMRSHGMVKRAVRAPRPSASGGAAMSAPMSEVEIEEEEVADDDIREAIRQLRKKFGD